MRYALIIVAVLALGACVKDRQMFYTGIGLMAAPTPSPMPVICQDLGWQVQCY